MHVVSSVVSRLVADTIAIHRLRWVASLACGALVIGCSPASQTGDTVAPATSPFGDAVEVIAPTTTIEPMPIGTFVATSTASLPAPVVTRDTSRRQTSTSADPVPTPTTTATRVASVSTPIDAEVDGVLRIDVAGPRSGGVLIYPSGNVFIPDPVFAGIGNSNLILTEIYAGLTRLTDDPNVPFELDMAERYSVRDGGVVYEFVLRKGLKFSDGTPVTASDFKWSWKRALSVSSRSATDEVSGVLGIIDGADEVLSGRSDELSGIEVIDDRTFSVRLNRKRADFMLILASPVASVLSRRNVESWGVDWTLRERQHQDTGGELFKLNELPLGTGSFKLAEFDVYSDRYRIVRNEHYHGRSAYLEGVEFVTEIFVDGIVEGWDGMRRMAETAFLEGSIDIDSLPRPGLEYDDRSSGIDASNYYRVETPGFIGLLVFNPSLPPYNDRNFRRALVAAIDLDRVLEVHGYDRAESISTYDTAGESSGASLIPSDEEEARAELAKSKYFDELDSLDLTFHYDTQGGFSEEIRRIVEMWEDELGVNADYRYVIPARYNELMEVNDVEAILLSFHPDYPDQHAIFGVFETMFGDRASSPELTVVEEMLEDAVTELDPILRGQKYLELERYLLENAIAVPLWRAVPEYYIAVQPWVHDYHVPKWGGARFEDTWFDDKAPDRKLP